MTKHWIYFFLLLWSFNHLSEGSSENEEGQKKKVEIAYPTMAPNSKFLNPHVDDATNLQFAVASFQEGEEEGKKPEGKALGRPSDSLASEKQAKNPRISKSLSNWKLIPFLNSIITGHKNYNFKRA